MTFNPFSDLYHSLWNDMECRGIEQHDSTIVASDTIELYADHLRSGAWTYDGYLKCCLLSRETSLSLNPTTAQLKKNPYLYIISEAMVGDCDDHQ